MTSLTRNNGGTNLRELAYDYLRTKLLEGRIPPGTRISSRALAREIGVSFIPVREAIAQLASEGLVDHEAGVGTFGTRLGVDDLRELYELREALELHAVHAAVLRIDPKGLAEMSGWNRVLRGIVQKRRLGSTDGLERTASNGRALSSNGHSTMQVAANGHAANGHVKNGNGTNGHSTNGHSGNGHATDGPANHGPANHGHAANGNGIARIELPTADADGIDQDLATWYHADIEFHLCMIRAAGNARLVDAVRDLRVVTQVCSAHQGMRPVEDLERSCKEHQLLIEALERRDVESARSILMDHIRKGCSDALAGHTTTAAEHKVTERSATERSTAERSTAERSTAERSTAERSAAERSATERSATEPRGIQLGT